jgi:hypothetical protein
MRYVFEVASGNGNDNFSVVFALKTQKLVNRDGKNVAVDINILGKNDSVKSGNILDYSACECENSVFSSTFIIF